MSDDLIRDESSHYEISLTAGQAFIAFVLLLLSLAAAFAFGIVIGRARGAEERVVVRNEPAVVTEGAAPREEDARIVELDDLESAVDASGQASVTAPEPSIAETPAESADPATDAPETPAPAQQQPPSAAPPAAEPQPEPSVPGPVFVQLLSSTEAKSAEALAARIIESGFNNAYVERVDSPTGMIYRVRVRFESEAEARAAVDRLRAISRTDPWVTRQ